MQASTIGRVNKVRLPASKPLLPLFEAIVNSVDAIEERSEAKGQIVIRVNREEDLKGMPEDSLPRISSFEVEDNGIGFTAGNFESFDTSDSRYKENRGAKGVGRFMWLKAFDHVEIESNFRENGDAFRRCFDFNLTDAGVEDHVLSPLSELVEPRTRLKLVQFEEKYQEKCPRKLDTIAHRIIEHCLVYFLRPNCPIVTLTDGETPTVLNDLFRDEYQKEAKPHTFEVKEKAFSVTLFKVPSAQDRTHKLLYVANSREVDDVNMERFVPDLRTGLPGEDGGTFFFVGCVTGEYLDSIVNNERTGFDFPKEEEDLVDTCITEKELYEVLAPCIAKAVESHVAPVHDEKMRRIRSYIEEDAPKYRTLFKYAPEQVERISPTASGATLEAELAKAQFHVEQDLRDRRQKLLGENERSVTSREDYAQALHEFVEKYDDMGKAKLAEYVAHRRVVLEFLDRALQQHQNGKYPLEEVIHDLVCPRRTVSDETSYDSLNLWVVDERFAYHYYLASDIPQDQMTTGDFNGTMRPDIAIFNRPMAFAEGETPYENVIILEFKRAGRDDYSDDENPITQVLDLIERFRAGKAKDSKSRIIPANANRRFYCYVVCDITPKLRQRIERESFIDTPDAQGFFRYHDNYKAYIEIIGFDKLLKDAKQRNRALFDRLNIT